MPDRIQINDRVTVGPQPSEDDLRALAEQGFKTVVNLRTAGEPDQPLPPEIEGLKVRENGMSYLHLPVSGADMRIDQVERFGEELHALPGPAYVHCRGGTRAAVFALLDAAERDGWTSDETLKRMADCGKTCSAPHAQEFVRGYLRTRRRAT